MVKTISKIFVIICLASISFAQQKSKIKSRRSELNSIREKIVLLKKEFQSKTLEEKRSIESLDNIKHQILLINKLVNNIKAEIKNKEAEINQLQTKILECKSEIKNLQEEFSKYVLWLYKTGNKKELEFLLESENFNDVVRRHKYFNMITSVGKKNLLLLKKNIKNLETLEENYKKEKKEKTELLLEKKKEQSDLIEKQKKAKKLLQQLARNKKNIESEIKEKRKAEGSIKKIIERLGKMVRTKPKKKKDKKNENEYVGEYNFKEFKDFPSLKGKLIWPINNGIVKRKFGKIQNKKLKTTTWNYGIDIEAEKSNFVKAVAEGFISAIEWIPGYGSVLILTHKNNYRTVYGHMRDITVNEGDKINGGETLGEVDNTLEGTFLHFEIWNSRHSENPETWLHKK